MDTLPLPPHPDVENYRKRAKDLVKAWQSDDPDAIYDWAHAWISSLSGGLGLPGSPRQKEIDRYAERFERQVIEKLPKAADKGHSGALAAAQFIIARAHSFDSWPKFVHSLEELARSGTEASDFEAAADAIVEGDIETLRRLIAANPALVRARSAREHRATLLHYTAANGVEDYRQKTPQNIVAITRLLLDAGAEVDAEADMYGGGSTTLGLAATSVHPYAAGVQEPLLQLLLDHGARLEDPPVAGNRHGAVMGCLANGRWEAAVFLAERGARLDLVTAAGVGRLDVVQSCFDEHGTIKPPYGKRDMGEAFRYACCYGSTEVAKYLLDRGVDIANHSGDGQTGAHYAGIGGSLETMQMLIARGAPLELKNEYGGTVLGQTLWSAAHGGDPDGYVAIIEALLKAGAKLNDRHPPVNAKVDALLRRYGSIADESLYWFGEKPRKPRSRGRS